MVVFLSRGRGVGLGLIGAAAVWSARAFGAAQRSDGERAQGRDRRGRPPAAAARRDARAPVFGTVDIEAVFKGYDKVKAQQEEFKRRRMAKQQRADEVPGRGRSRRRRCSPS